MANNVHLPENPKLASQMLEHKNKIDLIKAKQGWVGEFWGNPESAPHNIAAMVLFTCFLIGIVYSCLTPFFPTNARAPEILDFWGVLTPIITLILGYILGKKSSLPDE